MSYESEHNNSGFKIGDIVKISRTFFYNENNYKYEYSHKLDSLIGQIAKIIDDGNDMGFMVRTQDDSIQYVPWFILEEYNGIIKESKQNIIKPNKSGKQNIIKPNKRIPKKTMSKIKLISNCILIFIFFLISKWTFKKIFNNIDAPNKNYFKDVMIYKLKINEIKKKIQTIIEPFKTIINNLEEQNDKQK